jgi:hypothetical protein
MLIAGNKALRRSIVSIAHTAVLALTPLAPPFSPPYLVFKQIYNLNTSIFLTKELANDLARAMSFENDRKLEINNSRIPVSSFIPKIHSQ